MEAAIKANVEEIAVFGAASEAFTQRNIKCSIQESLERFLTVTKMAQDHNIKVRGYVSTVMGCPYQGAVDPNAVRDVTKALFELGCYEVSLGDTIGIGTPELTHALMESHKGFGVSTLAAHFHNTYDRAIENLVVALAGGIRVVDSSVAGLGGCPYAKGASGNVATEDVLMLLEILQMKHDVNHLEVCDIGKSFSKQLGRENMSCVKREDFEKVDELNSCIFSQNYE